MKNSRAPVSPFGVRIHTDTLPRGKRIRARARWTDPISGVRKSRSITVDSEASTYEFYSALRSPVGADLDPFITLTDYADQIGDRFLRGVDMTSTASGYRAGLRLRALPALGRLCIRDITTGIVVRSIDLWEIEHSRSTLKNTIAALTRVLDEALRDEIITRNPVRDRAHRRYRMREAPQLRIRIPSLTDVGLIAAACAEAHQSYGDHVMLSAFLAARTSEVAGLVVGDVDWTNRIVTIERQCFPCAAGLRIKPPKGRRARHEPIIEPLEPVLRRPHDAAGAQPAVVARASRRRHYDWGVAQCNRLGRTGCIAGVAGVASPRSLRHAGATWFANAGVPIHVVSDILGHASIETTRAYLHTDDTALQNAAARMNQHLREADMNS